MNNSDNYNFYLPGNGDYRLISQINSNFETVDDVLDDIEKAVAIVANGNTHAAISNGQFVYVRNHASLAEKLYRATSAIAENAALTSSNLTSVSGGGLNYLNSKKVTTQNSSTSSPELITLMLNNNTSGATLDVLTWGGGQAAGSSNVGGIMFTHSGRRYTFRGKGANNGNNEDFRLPAHSDGNSDVTYDILTSKDFPFKRAEGFSPSSGTNQITFTSPGEYRNAIVCCADKHFTIFYTTSSDTNIYTDNFPSGTTWELSKSGSSYTLKRNTSQSFHYTILWI